MAKKKSKHRASIHAPTAARPTASSWERNLFFNPERERQRLAEELWSGRRSQLPQEPLVWVAAPAAPQDDGGRPLSLTADQVERGQSLLRDGPHQFMSKVAAVQWLRRPEQGLHIDRRISDRTVDRRIVTPVWRRD
jgi:hypothetical protein